MVSCGESRSKREKGEAHLLHIDTVTGTRKDQARLHRFCETLGLLRNLLLFFSGKVDKVIIFGAHQKGNGCLVEAASLTIPLFDAVERGLARQIEHE